ncbi:chromosome partitioning protein MukE, partial [Escherichia coli]
EAQLRMIRDGEAMPIENSLLLNDEQEGEEQTADSTPDSAEDEQE